MDLAELELHAAEERTERDDPNGDSGGGDVSGLADAQNTGGVVDAIAERFAREDLERAKELDRLCGIKRKEDDVPKGVRAEPWPCCGSKSFRHMKGCDQSGKPAVPASKPTPERLARIVKAANKAKAPKPVAVGSVREISAMSVRELLELRRNVQEELEDRENELREQLDAIRGAAKSEAA